MEDVIQKIQELDALLCAVTGSQGADELTSEQITAYLTVCQRLASEALTAATR